VCNSSHLQNWVVVEMTEAASEDVAKAGLPNACHSITDIVGKSSLRTCVYWCRNMTSVVRYSSDKKIGGLKVACTNRDANAAETRRALLASRPGVSIHPLSLSMYSAHERLQQLPQQ
jgi:hypothetical protein